MVVLNMSFLFHSHLMSWYCFLTPASPVQILPVIFQITLPFLPLPISHSPSFFLFVTFSPIDCNDFHFISWYSQSSSRYSFSLPPPVPVSRPPSRYTQTLFRSPQITLIYLTSLFSHSFVSFLILQLFPESPYFQLSN